MQYMQQQQRLLRAIQQCTHVQRRSYCADAWRGTATVCGSSSCLCILRRASVMPTLDFTKLLLSFSECMSSACHHWTRSVCLRHILTFHRWTRSVCLHHILMIIIQQLDTTGRTARRAGLLRKLFTSPGPFYRNVKTSQCTYLFIPMHKHEVTPKTSYQMLFSQ